METQHCYVCKQTKDHDQFSKGKKGKHGLQSYCKECAAGLKFKYRYGITTAQFHERLAAQGDKCAVCEVPTSEYKARRNKRFNFGFVVDHDHTTGEVRGILCNECNVALGQFKDSPTALARAITYLEQQRKKI